MSRDIVAGPAAVFVDGRTGILSSAIAAVDFARAGQYGSRTTACELPAAARIARFSALAGARTAGREGRSKTQSKIELQHFLPATAAPFARLLTDRGRSS
jgi:hypothetical protein